MIKQLLNWAFKSKLTVGTVIGKLVTENKVHSRKRYAGVHF